MKTHRLLTLTVLSLAILAYLLGQDRPAVVDRLATRTALTHRLTAPQGRFPR
jgi:hypothetical protein